MKQKNRLIIVGIILLIIIIIWGLIGAQEATKLTNNCSLGLGERLCWFWEKNILGEVADIFKK